MEYLDQLISEFLDYYEDFLYYVDENKLPSNILSVFSIVIVELLKYKRFLSDKEAD